MDKFYNATFLFGFAMKPLFYYDKSVTLLWANITHYKQCYSIMGHYYFIKGEASLNANPKGCTVAFPC